MLRFPAVVLAISAGITLLFAIHLPGLVIHSSIYDFVISDMPENIRYREFKSIFGSDEIIRIVMKNDDVLSPGSFAQIREITSGLSAIGGVRRVISLPEIKSAVDPAGRWNLEQFRALLAPVDLFRRNIVSDDFKSTSITVILESDAAVDTVLERIDEIIRHYSGTGSIYQIGMPTVSRALAEFTKNDFLRLPPLAFMVIAIVLWGLFARLRFMILPIATVGTALLWTLGFMAWTRIPLSMLTMIVPVFIVAVGTAYCIYLCSEYTAWAGDTSTSAAAVSGAFSHTAMPTVLAVITTVCGLGSLWVNRITAIHEFALSAVFGTLAIMVTALTTLPALLALLPLPPKTAGAGRPGKMIDTFLSGIVGIVLRRQRTALSIIGLFTVVCALGILRLRAETNPVDYLRQDAPVSRHFQDIHKHLSGCFPINVVMNANTPDYFENAGHVSAIARLQERLESFPGVDKAVSFADYLKLVNYAQNRFQPAAYSLPEKDYQLRILLNNYRAMFGEDMFERFMSIDLSRTNVLLMTHISSSREFLRLREMILAQIPPKFPGFVTWEVTGLGVVVSASSHLLVRDQTKSIAISMGLIFGIVLLLFLSGRVGLVAIGTVLFPVIVNFGLMGWLGIRLSVATSLIASIAIGLAVDDIIHYLVRYSREFKKDLDKDRALRDTISAVGRPIIFTSLAISLGFSVLIFSHFAPTAIFGFLMMVTMSAALIGDLILLPSLMLHLELVTAWDLIRLMPTLGGMSAGIAHELNQPLTVIKMGSEILGVLARQDGNIPKDHLLQVAGEISEQVERASNIIQSLRSFDPTPDFRTGRININDPVKDTLALVGHQLDLDNIECTVDLQAGLPEIIGQHNRLCQVVYNLVTNAREAIIAGCAERGVCPAGRITIRTGFRDRHVLLSVADDGIGIPPRLQDRIFEPFFTTKDSGRGKGLGLTIIREIVRKLNGCIYVDSGQRQGTTVTLTFPPETDRGLPAPCCIPPPAGE